MSAQHQSLSWEDAADSSVDVHLYNPTYNEYLFVSNTKKGGDNVLESHLVTCRDEQRNRFRLQRADGNKVLLYNPSYGLWLFVSNDKWNGDNVVEAHQYQGEERNKFVFENAGNNRYRIFNPSYNHYVFVSNDKDGPDHVVESHSNRNEARNEFVLEMSDAPVVESITYDQSQMKSLAAKPPLVIGSIDWTNIADAVQAFDLRISETRTFESAFTTTKGLTLGASVSVKASLPGGFGGEVSATSSFEFSSSTSSTKTASNSVQFEGLVKIQIPPRCRVVGQCEVPQEEVEVPYTMTIRASNGYKFQSQGIYSGVALRKYQIKTEQTPLS